MENMRRCIEWYKPAHPVRVIDLGAADVNGSYRQLFDPEDAFTGFDLAPGNGVDVVLEDPYHLPLPDASVDIVVSGQMLEHCPQFWRQFTEIARVMKEGGLAFIIAPSAGKIHRYPVDCYRFYPDAYEALAEWSGLRLVHHWLDERGPWRDLVGVFQKGGDLKAVTAPKPAKRLPLFDGEHPDPAAEATGGKVPYLDVLAQMHALLKPRLYLEIGVRKGKSLRLCQGDSIGIDPSADLDQPPENLTFFPCTSDDFFFFHAQTILKKPVDFAFIDGMHLLENVYRDFANLERFMASGGVVCIDDVLPNHPLQAKRDRCTRVWCGDVWRLISILAAKRPDLQITLLDTAPSGLLVIRKLNPKTRVLLDTYNPLMRKLLEDDPEVPEDVLLRKAALTPNEATIRSALGLPSVA
ncbi:methyltransferase domain-containing protein [Cereibacter sphaeroides]|nr:methyltransferase domain-containing protein [Cereibacter sphaeroides]